MDPESKLKVKLVSYYQEFIQGVQLLPAVVLYIMSYVFIYCFPIRADAYKRELVAQQKVWPKKYSFLVDKYREVRGKRGDNHSAF